MNQREKRIRFIKSQIAMRIRFLNRMFVWDDLMECGIADLTVIEALESGRK